MECTGHGSRGNGVLTIGSLLAMSAHLEGKGCSTLNQTGLAQKFGAVVSHVKIAQSQENIRAVRIPDGEADLLLGCDLVVSAGVESLSRLNRERSQAIVNSYEHPTAEFIHNRDYAFPGDTMKSLIEQESGTGGTHFVNATEIARSLLGDTIGSNLFLLGFSYQKGLLPLDEASIFRAVELNGVAVEFNKRAFTWGRRAAVSPDAVAAHAGLSRRDPPPSLDETVAYRHGILVRYQDIGYADRYKTLVDEVERYERSRAPGADHLPLTEAVAMNYFRLLAYKDEYEVARLYTDSPFVKEVRANFKGNARLSLHMAPPWLSGTDPHTGHPLKRAFPELALKVFALLARLRFLRGTALDPFGRTDERRRERELIGHYEQDVELVLRGLTERNRKPGLDLLRLPGQIRGFGHVKATSIREYRHRRNALRKEFSEPDLSLVVNR